MRGQEGLSERDPTGPGVVAGILGADFICRMSTSRAGEAGLERGREDAECEAGALSSRVKERERGEKKRETARRGAWDPGPDPDRTGPNGN